VGRGTLGPHSFEGTRGGVASIRTGHRSQYARALTSRRLERVVPGAHGNLPLGRAGDADSHRGHERGGGDGKHVSHTKSLGKGDARASRRTGRESLGGGQGPSPAWWILFLWRLGVLGARVGVRWGPSEHLDTRGTAARGESWHRLACPRGRSRVLGRPEDRPGRRGPGPRAPWRGPVRVETQCESFSWPSDPATRTPVSLPPRDPRPSLRNQNDGPGRPYARRRQGRARPEHEELARRACRLHRPAPRQVRSVTRQLSPRRPPL